MSACGQTLKVHIATFRMFVISKDDIGTNKHIVTHTHTIPQLHAALDGAAVANDDVILNQAMRADVAVSADLGTGQYNDRLRDARTCTDLAGLNVS